MLSMGDCLIFGMQRWKIKRIEKKGYFTQILISKESGKAILISDKIDCKSKLTKKQIKALYIDKRIILLSFLYN